MKELQFTGYREGPYPSDAVDVDFGQGRIRGRPVPSSLFSVPSGTCHALHYHAESGYYVAVIGNVLYRLTAGSSTTLASSINPPASIHQFGDRIVCVATNKVVVVDPSSSWNTRTVARPNRPTGITAEKYSWSQSDFTNINNAGLADVSINDDRIDVDDNTTDPVRGAWAELYRSSPISEFVAYAIVDVLAKDGALVAATIQAINAVSDSSPQAMGPSLSCFQAGRVVIPVAGRGLRGFRVWTDSGLVRLWRVVHLVPEVRPLAYRVTAVDASGWESEPLEVPVAGSTKHEDIGYYVQLSNLGSGTKRIYRQDALGYWRRVAETTASSYLDTIPDEELGQRLVDIPPPTGGYSAIVWQGRLCIATGNELYVSAPGQFNFSTHEGGDKLRLPSGIKALVDAGNALMVGADDGWYALAGAPGAWVVSRMGMGAPPDYYHSHLPVLNVNRTLIVNKQVVATGRRVVSTASAGEYTVVVTDQEWLVYAGNRWARWQLPSVPIVAVPGAGADARFGYIHNGQLYAVSMPASSRIGFTLSQKFPLPERGQVRFIHVDGAGHATATINSQQFASTEAMPITADWKRAEAWVLDVQLSVVGELYRMLVDVEAMSVRR